MIEPTDRSEQRPRVICRCDDCGHSEYQNCDYERQSGGAWKPNEGQVIHRLTKNGWTHIKGKLRCMACSVKRKAEKPEMTENVTPLRQPTREQKRQIIELLGEVYDTTIERYRGAESDVTVAEAIGGGCMFGWVAEIREELFGPDGRNEELDALRADISVWQETSGELLTKAHAAIRAVEDHGERAKDFQRRMDALLKAAGPRGKAIA
ncbi:hypothetical protein G5V65_11260 [Rhodobacter sp. HX-7-19]|uniref:Uncharacterized protein n=1 Tax=Paragemmobacter kunshanensis TaxID=2583234 RepID=A0A6M1U5C0_9RHOB|nr:hypothetical protein [Rhodobacter kunshanensis]NGQ91475.1 hypothetical protein [Rhodobacter kunshanensis]